MQSIMWALGRVHLLCELTGSFQHTRFVDSSFKILSKTLTTFLFYFFYINYEKRVGEEISLLPVYN